MRTLKIIFIIVVFIYSCGTKDNEKGNIHLSGTFSNSKQDTIYITFLPAAGPPIILDTTFTDEKGNFEFAGLKLPGIGFYTLNLTEQQFCPLILDSGMMVKITGDAMNLGYTYKTEGSEDSKILQDITNESMRFQTSIDSLGQLFKQQMAAIQMAKDSFDVLSKKFEIIYNEMLDVFSKKLIAMVNQHPNSLAGISAVGQLDPDKYIDEYIKLDANLSKKYSDFSKITRFHEQVEKLKVLSVGSLAPEINLQNVAGERLNLTSLRGKIVLVDFWASWCKPCMAEVPNVKKQYEMYKKKGFEILGVSLDTKKEDWLNAIQQNNMNWLQGCDVGANGNSIAAQNYQVSTIPFTVLLDKEGKIIAKNLRGNALEEKLKQIFNN